MSKPSSDLGSLLLKADALIDAAFAAEYRQDPVLGALSRAHGIAQCVTREHGLLLEEAIAVGLRRSGTIDVSRNIRFPITDAARSLVATNRTDTLDRVRLTFDAEARTTFDLDLAAVAIDGSRAWAVDVKRGGGSTGGTRRTQTERELLAVKLLLRSFFRQQGYAADDVSVAVIDVYGCAGFTQGLTVTRNGIDDFFGVPVLDVIDALDGRLRRRLDAAWAGLAASMAVPREMSGRVGQAPDGDGTGDDTPVASTRSPWGQAFAVGARRAAPSRSGTRAVPLVLVEPDRRGGHWPEALRNLGGRTRAGC